MRDTMRSKAVVTTRAVSLAMCGLLTGMPLSASSSDDAKTTTPIKHVVVIFQENRSFDQYFGSYPYAANLPGENPFHARANTPTVNNLQTAGLLTANPNSANPMRLSPAEAIVCSDSHDYTDEQKAFDNGLMDMFPEHTASSGCALSQVVDYFDGNTVTALWNYAQHFAMSDNSFNTTFGPSSPGAVNLVSGQTHGIAASIGNISGDVVEGTLIGDADPLYDDCASPDQVGLSGKNIGDLLNAKHVTGAGSKAASAIAMRRTRRRMAECAKTTFPIISRSCTTPRRQTRIICGLRPWR